MCELDDFRLTNMILFQTNKKMLFLMIISIKLGFDIKMMQVNF